jgi:hypothetical protein
MKKITDRKIAGILSLTPQNIYNWKKQKPLQYEAVKGYFLLKENKIFDKLKKIKALASLVEAECDSDYAKELKALADEVGEVVENLEKK